MIALRQLSRLEVRDHSQDCEGEDDEDDEGGEEDGEEYDKADEDANDLRFPHHFLSPPPANRDLLFSI